jgi:hypothetical protein
MDGAIESGERVANEIIYTLFKDDKSVKCDYEKTYYAHKEQIEEMKRLDEKRLARSRLLCNLSKFLVKSAVLVGLSAVFYSRLVSYNFGFKLPWF